jgi:outer membrane protease
LSGRFIFSSLVSADAEDTHHLRDLYYKDEMDSGHLLGFDLALTMPLSEHLSLIGLYSYQKYDSLQGGETITDLITGQSEYHNDSAGMDQTLSLLTLSLAYSF